MKIKLILLLILVASNFVASAQFEIQGIIRPRFEFRDGYSTLRNDTTSPAAFVSQRTRLNFLYKKGNLETMFSIYDFRVWGNQALKQDRASLGLNEAWAKIYLNDAWSIKLGRQSLKYDNSRFISPVNWNQIGAAHDGVLVQYKNNNCIIEFGTAYNQSSINKFGTYYELFESHYKSLNFLWISKKFKNFTISSLSILDGKQDLTQPKSQNFRLTAGIIPQYYNDKFKVTARIFGQGGNLQNNQKIQAFYTNPEFSYSVNKHIKLIAGNEIKSGNDATDSLNTTSNAFDILYGARHKFNGRIDYFSTPSTTNGAGLIDSYFKLNYRFSEHTNLSTDFHYFMLQNNYIEGNVIINKFLGHEIDFVLKQNLAENVNLEAGYSFIFAGESLETIKSGNKDLLNHWFYLMITIDPKLFNR